MAVAYEPRPGMQRSERLEQLFWAHNERVLRAAYRITGNMADAEDVTQAVFLRLANQGAEQIENAESYLYRAAINGALDLLRSRRADRFVELDVAAEKPSAGWGHSAEQSVSERELREWLRSALAVLSPRAAEMFVLRYVEDLNNREIAGLMGTSRAVVAVMLHQAKSKLKKRHRMFLRGER